MNQESYMSQKELFYPKVSDLILSRILKFTSIENLDYKEPKKLCEAYLNLSIFSSIPSL